MRRIVTMSICAAMFMPAGTAVFVATTLLADRASGEAPAIEQGSAAAYNVEAAAREAERDREERAGRIRLKPFIGEPEREWTEGNQRTKATLIAMTGEGAQLMTNGKVKSVAFDSLSKADRGYIKLRCWKQLREATAAKRKTELTAKIADLEEQIAAIKAIKAAKTPQQVKRTPSNPRGVPPVKMTAAEKSRRLSGLQSKLEGIREDLQKVKMPDFGPNIYTPLEIGMAGELPYSLEITQVVSPTSALVMMQRTDVFYNPAFIRLLLRGINTQGVTDGQTISLKQPAIVVGTYSYRTTLGAKSTVFVLEPVEDNAKLTIE